MRYLKELTAALTANMPRETILLTASRAQGRRMLAACAAEGALLLGVRAETMTTLAADLCAEQLSRKGAPHLMEETEAVEIVRSCLKGQSGYFGKPVAQNLPAAQELYHTFLELEQACAPAFSGSEKLDSVQSMRELYMQKKKEQGLLDRTDLLHMALESTEAFRARDVRFVVLASYAPTPLERKLLSALSGDALTVVPLTYPEGVVPPEAALATDMPVEKPLATLAGRSRFARCRGIDTEVRFVFRDILDKQLSVEDCAVVYLSGEYAQRLYETAGRYSIPVTMADGVPFTGSLLYTTLKKVAALVGENYDAEQVCELLESGACLPEHRLALAKALRTKRIGWGRERYAYVLQYEDGQPAPDAETLADWEQFLTGLLTAAAQEGSLEEQREALLGFLTYCNAYFPGEGGACVAVKQRIGQVKTLSDGETLLRRLLRMLENTSYLSASAAPGKLFCGPLSQALCTGRKYLYIIGLSRYCLQSGRESPVLLDAERTVIPHMKTVEDQERERTFLLNLVLLQHQGSVVFTYPDYDSVKMMDLLPAPLYTDALQCAGVSEEVVTYLPQQKLTAGDHMRDGKAYAVELPWPTPADEGTCAELAPKLTLKEQLQHVVYSPSAIESALRCPLSFYLQRLLQIRPQKQLERREDRWLEKNVMGTYCHEVLEHFYEGRTELPDMSRPEEQKLLEELLETAAKKLERENPVARESRKKADLERAREMVRSAIAWTESQGRTVLATERDFGTEPDEQGGRGLELEIGKRKVLLQGSIDRVDRLADGSRAILDYKTGDAEKMEREKDLHLQHYLYTLAEQKLGGEETAAKEAGYLLLESGAQYMPGDTGEYERAAALVDLLLAWMEDEQQAQTPVPCFELNDKMDTLSLGSDKVRVETYEGCQRYCLLRDLCPVVVKGDSDDD